MAEKRIKLDVDDSSLLSELSKIDQVSKRSADSSIKGQQEFNRTVKETNDSLKEQSKLLKEIGESEIPNNSIPIDESISNRQSNFEVNSVEQGGSSTYESNIFNNNIFRDNLFEGLDFDIFKQSIPQQTQLEDNKQENLEDKKSVVEDQPTIINQIIGKESEQEIVPLSNLQNDQQSTLESNSYDREKVDKISDSKTAPILPPILPSLGIKNSNDKDLNSNDLIDDIIFAIASGFNQVIDTINDEDISYIKNDENNSVASINDTQISLIEEHVSDILTLIRDRSNSNSGGNSNNAVFTTTPPGGGGPGNTPPDNGGGGGSSLGRYANPLVGAPASRNELYAAASLAAVIPWVGSGLSSLLNRILQAGDRLSSERDRYYATSGNYSGISGDFNSIGLTQADAFSAQTALRSSYDRTSYEDIAVSKAFNISENSLLGLARTLRNNNEFTPVRNSEGEEYLTELTAGQTVETLLNRLTTVVGRDNSRAYIEEYLDILVNLNREQLNTSGKIETFANTELIRQFASLGKEFQNPEYLSAVIQGISQGVRQAATPQVEALQFATLSAINPDASLWELEKMRQNPFSQENEQYLPDFLKRIVEISGNGDEAYFNLGAVFPQLKNNFSAIEAIVENVRGNRPLSAEFLNDNGFNIEDEAQRATSTMQRITARQEDFLAGWGENLIETYEDIAQGFKSAVDKLSGIVDFFTGNKDETTNIWGIKKDLTDLENSSERTAETLERIYRQNNNRMANPYAYQIKVNELKKE